MKINRLCGVLMLGLVTLVSPVRASEQGTFVMPDTGPMSLSTFVDNYLNPALRAIASCHWGTSAPVNGPSGASILYQCWADTTSNPVLVKRWDGAQWSIEGALDASAHTWTPYRNGAPIVAVATSGSAADLVTGTLPAARLPAPTATTLGGVESLVCSTSNWLYEITTAGAPGCRQPSFSDLLGLIAPAQIPVPTATSLGGVEAHAAVSHQYLTQIGTDGSASAAQPSCDDLSNSVASCKVDTTTQANVAFTGLSAAGAAADTDTFPTNQGAGNLKQTLAAIKTWIKGWIAKADVGLANVDNTSDATKNAAAVTLTNHSFDTASNTFDLNGVAAGTAAQMTAALNGVVGDAGSGGTKGLVPAPGAGDGAAGKYLKADGTWGVPPGSGGGGALSDTDRQNILLDRIYQAKVYGLSGIGSYRRVIDNFADGFTTTDGINASSSSNYQFDNVDGIIEPTDAAGPNLSTSADAIVSSTGNGSAGVTADGVTNSGGWASGETSAGVSGVSYVGQNFGTGVTKAIRQMVIYQGWSGDATYSVTSVLAQYSDNGSAWTTVATVSLLAVTSAQTISLPSGGSHQYWRLLANSAPGAANRWGVMELQMMEYSMPNNMTVVTASQATDAAVSSGRVLLEIDNSAMPTLNTDLTAEVTCNGGTNWSTATLSSVSAHGQAGRSVAETTDTACTSGSSFATRIKTLNNKNIPVYGVSVTVH